MQRREKELTFSHALFEKSKKKQLEDFFKFIYWLGFIDRPAVASEH